MSTTHLAHGGEAIADRGQTGLRGSCHRACKGGPCSWLSAPFLQHPRVIWVSTSWSLSLMMTLGPRYVTSLLMSRAIR